MVQLRDRVCIVFASCLHISGLYAKLIAALAWRSPLRCTSMQYSILEGMTELASYLEATVLSKWKHIRMITVLQRPRYRQTSVYFTGQLSPYAPHTMPANSECMFTTVAPPTCTLSNSVRSSSAVPLPSKSRPRRDERRQRTIENCPSNASPLASAISL